MESWEDIEEFENKYQVSTKGFVRSLHFNNTDEVRILKPKINKQGYLEVTLNKDNKHYYRTVARIVIETYTGIKLTKNDIVMYKDGNKENCALENLYLISRGKRQELTYDLDHRYRPKYEYYGKFLSTKEISKMNGIDSKIIRDRIRRLYWSIYEAGEIPVAIFRKRKEQIKK